MKLLSTLLLSLIFLHGNAFAQGSPKKDVFTRVDNKLNKASTVISVFQPYLLKARQIFFDTKELAGELKRSAKQKPSEESASQKENQEIMNYLPEQNLPVNDPATINVDGTGNWGNQNNGLYGNCLNVLTGAVMGLGEAEESPKSVDVIFVAANGSYQLWSPEYARNQVAAQYTSRSTYESVSKWNDVNETEIAETRLTAGQFDKIQTNSQILNAVKNAPNYASSLTLFGKLDGKVFAVKAELEDRTVYGLIKVVKHYGTEGNNGYLKIQIKAEGINNGSGQIDVNAYLR